jgi:RNA polymerase sigma-70 factor (ECF subfamily)
VEAARLRSTLENSSGTGSTDSKLLARVRQGDNDAWTQLVDLYGPLVFHWCRRAGLSPPDAADVFQEVFRGVATNVSGFERQGRGAFRGWLWSITQHKLGDQARRSRGRSQAVGGQEHQRLLDETPDLHAPPEDTEGEEFSPAIYDALETIRAEFEPRTWQAFWRTVVEDRLAADVAAELGLTLPAVYTAKSRVLRRLRLVLGGPPA